MGDSSAMQNTLVPLAITAGILLMGHAPCAHATASESEARHFLRGPHHDSSKARASTQPAEMQDAAHLPGNIPQRFLQRLLADLELPPPKQEHFRKILPSLLRQGKAVTVAHEKQLHIIHRRLVLARETGNLDAFRKTIRDRRELTSRRPLARFLERQLATLLTPAQRQKLESQILHRIRRDTQRGESSRGEVRRHRRPDGRSAKRLDL